MAQGWSILAPLEAQHPDKPIDPSTVESVYLTLTRLNDGLLERITNALFEKGLDDESGVSQESGSQETRHRLFVGVLGSLSELD
jgi:hypothetical protein